MLERADHLAETVLAPGAAEVDRASLVPPERLDAVAAAGFHGLTAPTSVGGIGATPATVDAVVERFAAACLPTTFVWLQHLGVAARVAACDTPAAEIAPRLADGSRRAGVAIGGVRPGVEPLIASPIGDGWQLDGPIPWITGWGSIDVVLVAAMTGEERSRLVWSLVDVGSASASPPAGWTTRRFDLVATDAASSVAVRCDAVLVGARSVVAIDDRADWLAADHLGLAMNAALSLGITRRAVGLLERFDGPAAEFAARLDDTRCRVVAADPRRTRATDGAATVEGTVLADRRAEAALLAWEAAAAVATAQGGAGLAAGSETERLVREAHFCLVFGTRPEIRAAQLARLTRR